MSVQRIRCLDCGAKSNIPLAINTDPFENQTVVDLSQPSPVTRRYVITSYQNNTEIFMPFLQTLESYCTIHNADLMAIRVRYNAPDDEANTWWDPRIEPKLVDTMIDLCEHVRVYGNIKILPTAEMPTSGMEPLSKGKTIIIGHNQLQMRVMPVSANSVPALIHTTGTISTRRYVISKAGEKANFNHSFSALVVEIEPCGDFHIRVLNADEHGGFVDVGAYYDSDGSVEWVGAEAIVFGDEHAIYADPEVVAATFTDANSLVSYLEPKVLVRHDIVDSASVSHHNIGNTILNYHKFMKGTNVLQRELELTAAYMEKTTPQDATNWIVGSNHHDHITKWLNRCNPKDEPWNARIYHWLMLTSIDLIDKDMSPKTPFQLWIEHFAPVISERTKFLSRKDQVSIKGIEISHHGDVGISGSRGSADQFSKLPNKTITGHSHSPFIKQGAYGVGCTCIKDMDYVNGPGSWLHTHCVVYSNGKRQLITIVNGKWRAPTDYIQPASDACPGTAS